MDKKDCISCISQFFQNYAFVTDVKIFMFQVCIISMHGAYSEFVKILNVR